MQIENVLVEDINNNSYKTNEQCINCDEREENVNNNSDTVEENIKVSQQHESQEKSAEELCDNRKSTENFKEECELVNNHGSTASEENVGQISSCPSTDDRCSTPTTYAEQQEVKNYEPVPSPGPCVELHHSFIVNEVDISFELSNLSIYDEPESPKQNDFKNLKTVKIEIIEVSSTNYDSSDTDDLQIIKPATLHPIVDYEDFTKDTVTGVRGYIDLKQDAPVKVEKIVEPVQIKSEITELPSNKRKRADDKPHNIDIIPESKKFKPSPTKHDHNEKLKLKSLKSTTYRTHTPKELKYKELRSTNNIISPRADKNNKTEKLAKLPNLVKNIIKNEPETKYWSTTSKTIDNNLMFKIYKGSEEYDMVTDHFTDYDDQNDYHILNVERIENPSLMAAFVMKRHELQDTKPSLPVRTKLLFHATKYSATESIIKENFDWRLSGAARGHKYGFGTCFSPYSDFATQFGQQLKSNIYYTLLCYVMEKKSQIGNTEMIIPDVGYDTSRSRDGKVIVKYHDNTAYPAYRITYRKCEKYHDDIHMQRNDWFYGHQATNNYHSYNQHYSQYSHNNQYKHYKVNNFHINSWAPQTNVSVNFNFPKVYDTYNDAHRKDSKKQHHKKNRRYTPY